MVIAAQAAEMLKPVSSVFLLMPLNQEDSVLAELGGAIQVKD